MCKTKARVSYIKQRVAKMTELTSALKRRDDC